MKKNLHRTLALLISSAVIFSACGGDAKGEQNAKDNPGATQEAKAQDEKSEETGGSGETIIVDFWSAPQKTQFDYWDGLAKKFNNEGVEIGGKKIEVKVQQMPETPSSEAGIQNALATDTAPAISENVNRGFAAVLGSSDAAYDLSGESWYNEIIENRSMNELIKGWEIEGNQYVLPVFVNPMVWQWNAKALEALGVAEVPKTVDDIKALITKFREEKDGSMKEAGVSHIYYRPSLQRPDLWWETWFDFQGQYSAFTKGGAWVEGDKLMLTESDTKDVLEFYGLFGDTLFTSEVTDIWLQDTVNIIASVCAPWEINLLTENGKVYGEDYVYGPNIVKNAGDQSYCFADSKGLVLYKDTNITDEVHNGACEFVKWVYITNDSAEADLEWLKVNNMLPARGDLNDNELLSSYLKENPALMSLADFVGYSVPSMDNPDMSEIQTVFGETALAPYIDEAITVTDLNAPDASSYVSESFAAMKEAGGLQ